MSNIPHETLQAREAMLSGLRVNRVSRETQREISKEWDRERGVLEVTGSIIARSVMRRCRSVEIEGERYCVLRDVLKAVGSKTSPNKAVRDVAKHRPEWLTEAVVLDSMGRQQKAQAVNEDAIKHLLSKGRTELCAHYQKRYKAERSEGTFEDFFKKMFLARMEHKQAKQQAEQDRELLAKITIPKELTCATEERVLALIHQNILDPWHTTEQALRGTQNRLNEWAAKGMNPWAKEDAEERQLAEVMAAVTVPPGVKVEADRIKTFAKVALAHNRSVEGAVAGVTQMLAREWKAEQARRARLNRELDEAADVFNKLENYDGSGLVAIGESRPVLEYDLDEA